MSKRTGGNGFRPQARDEAILRDLLDCRIMTIKQGAALHFGGRFEAAKKRLQKLHAAGFIAPRERRVQEPAIYSLTRKGYMSLKEEGMLDPLLELGWARMQDRIRVGELMLRHELAVMDVKAALAPAIGSTGEAELLEFTVNPDRHAFRVAEAVLSSKKLVGFRSVRAKPDGFLHAKETGCGGERVNHYFFLEVDRGTESLARIVKKARHYSQHYRGGGFAARHGCDRRRFKLCPFRVLMVFPSAERRNNVAEKLLQLRTPPKSMFWLTTMNEIMADPLGSVWVRPMDYERAVRGTVFDMATTQRPRAYRRNRAREEWAESHVAKRRLMGG